MLGKILGDPRQIKVCIVCDGNRVRSFEARPECNYILVTLLQCILADKMKPKARGAHLFLLHVLIIIRIACDVYCIKLKAKLQFMYILTLCH